MASREGDQEKEYSPSCWPASPSLDTSASSLWTAGAISSLIPCPPAIGTVQKLGLGEESPTQTVTLFASGYQAAEAAHSLFCARNSARTSRGALPSSCAK